MANIRFKVLEPTPDGDYNIQGQPLTVVDVNGLFMTLVLDGTTIIDTTDVGSESFPMSGTTTENELNWTLSKEDTDWFKLNVVYKTEGVHESTSLAIALSKSNFLPYDGSVTLYNYDLGNNNNQLYDIGNPITENPEFNFILIPYASNNIVTSGGVQLRPYASIIAYRRPYTNIIHILKNNSSIGDHVIALDGESDALFTGSSGITEQNDSVILIATHTSNSITSQSDNVSVPLIIWKPTFTTSISAPENNADNTETINVFGDPDFLTNIDIDGTSTVYINDVKTYGFNHMQLIYKVYDKTGTLVNQKTINANVRPYPYAFDINDWDFEDFLTDSLGDYLIIVTLRVIGILQDGEFDSGDSLTEGEVYRIINNDSADFTLAGASDNNIGTEFYYNGGLVTWGNGILQQLSSITECTSTTTVVGDTWTSIEQTGCSDYKILSNALRTLFYIIYELDSNGNFVQLATESTGSISQLDSTTISFSSDNVYKITVFNYNPEEPQGLPTEESYDYIVINYCNFRSCLLKMLDEVICKDPSCKCKQSKHYEFNALVINATAYFNILNAEYAFNYIYESISPNKLLELRELKEFLDRMTDYCTSCTESCDNDNECGC